MRVCVSHTLNFFVIRIRSVLFLLGPHAVPKMLFTLKFLFQKIRVRKGLFLFSSAVIPVVTPAFRLDNLGIHRDLFLRSNFYVCV